MDHSAETWTLPLEVRLHGRGGQGGVTCAKLIAALFSHYGLHVQTFGDYGAERAGAPVQAYVRADAAPVTNPNKIYSPNHLLVLDESLLCPAILEGGELLLINSPQGLTHFAGACTRHRLGVVDATAIARAHGIGSASVVIINTTIAGAYARMLGLPLAALDEAYAHLGLEKDLKAAEAAFHAVEILKPRRRAKTAVPQKAAPAPVLPMLNHREDIAPLLKTGNWSNKAPVYHTQRAPCAIACPAGTDMAAVLQALKTEGLEAAAARLYATQPLPSVCGRVCPAPCMKACNRAAFDGAVNIRSLERYIGDWAASLPPRAQTQTPKRIAIVGGGPAGLSAAWQLALRGYDASLFEASARLGGVLASGIPQFRLPKAALERDLKRLQALGVTVHLSSPVGKAALARLRQSFDAVIVAVGLGGPAGLGIEGEALATQGLDFLAAAKETPPELTGPVVVVGGGNTAIDCARTARRCGASSVSLVYRRSKAEMPAIGEEIAEAEREGIIILPRRQPVAIHPGFVEVAQMEAGPPDASGRSAPLLTTRRQVLPAATVLLALGQKSNGLAWPAGWSLHNGQLLENGEALNIFLAGDCSGSEATVAHAIGSGRKAAEAAIGLRPSEETAAPSVPASAIRFSAFAAAPPQADYQTHSVALTGDFSETNLGLPGLSEVERCFSCGLCTRCDACLAVCPEGVVRREADGYRADPDYCKGCGLCAAECPRGGMSMQVRA